MGAFLSRPESESHWMKKRWTLGTVFAAVALVVAVVGVPWGLYARSKAAKLANEAKPSSSQPTTQPAATNQSEATPAASETSPPVPSSDAADLAAKRQREERAKERAKAQDAAKLLAKDGPGASNSQSSPASGAKKVTVQVTYDENGRVTQASGGDATALRIARQKRFPAGKAGSATITIPIN